MKQMVHQKSNSVDTLEVCAAALAALSRTRSLHRPLHCAPQVILGLVRLTYDECLLRSARLKKTFNGNKLFATFGGP